MKQQYQKRDVKLGSAIVFTLSMFGLALSASSASASDLFDHSYNYGGSAVSGDVVYLAGTAGTSKVKIDAADISSFDPGATVSADDKDTSLGLSGGYQFNSNVAAELGYVDLGSFSADAKGTESGLSLTETAKFEAKGFQASVVGSMPVSKEFSVLGRLGMFRWDLKSSNDGVEAGVPFSGSEKATGIDLTYGLGVQYNFSKVVGARFEWQKFKDVGDQDKTGQSDVDLISLGLVYRFPN